MKYIIVMERGHEVPILFDNLISHDLFLNCYAIKNICSAGFCEYYLAVNNNIKINTWGLSTSLLLQSRKVDDHIIENSLNRK